MHSSAILAAAALVTAVAAHGSITTPLPRAAGENYKTVCGQQVYNNQAADRNGNIQGVLQVANGQTDVTPACNVWLCKGFTFEDNTANVQTYTPGQVVPITFNLAAPHTGTANMSIVNTASNTIIGSPLLSWDVYASTSVPISSSETSFSITIPSDLGSQCATAGACVIQHFWDARSVDQTYESCIDFTVAGSGSDPAGAPPVTPATTPAANPPATTPPSTPATTPPAAPPAALTTLRTSVTSAAAPPGVTPYGTDDCDL
ncbi:hypothetical protein PZA11_002188 [Diplocarpon coronariae]|uniref:Chitin-binding type-4 domain-containing protein n=1 Tax=Diplocarpon coronariae TaxID=2795749 RepID=A0A218ZEY8_9HELO|nr:hypothetical protein JHW43_007913 [Diplocarpon mali]OWP06150.1 hypothetical protein B2J93_789 [Marssonina coronariae]